MKYQYLQCLVVFSLFSFLSNFAYSKSLDTSTEVGLVGFSSNSSSTKEFCELLKNSVWKWSAYTKQPPNCVYLTSSKQVKSYIDILKSKTVGHFITIINDSPNHQYKLSIFSLKAQDETEPEKLSWEIKVGPKALPAIQKILEDYSFFDSHIDQFKKSLMDISLASAPSEASLKKLSENKYLIKKNNYTVDFKEAYRQFLEESKTNKNYLAAGLEIAAILGLATANYY